MSRTNRKARLSSTPRDRKTRMSSASLLGNAKLADTSFAQEIGSPEARSAVCTIGSEKSSIAASDLLHFASERRFATILADPPWRFTNRTGKMAPEHKRLSRYGTMTFEEIMALPVGKLVPPTAHLYLWCPNALLPQGLDVMKAW